MSDINFNCPYCSQNFDAPEDMAGEDVDCPKCNNQIKVPFPAPLEPQPEPEPVPEAIPEPVKVHIPAPVMPPARPVISSPVVQEPIPVPPRRIPDPEPAAGSSIVEESPAAAVPEPIPEPVSAPVSKPQLGGIKKGFTGKPAFGKPGLGKKPGLGGGLAGSAIAQKQAAFAAQKAAQKSQTPVVPKQQGESQGEASGSGQADTPPDTVNPVSPAVAVRSKLALWSLITAILGFSPVSIVLGHMAISRIKKSGGALKGKGMAVAGLVLGYIAVIAYICLVASIIIAAKAVKDVVVEGVTTVVSEVSAESGKAVKENAVESSVEEVKADEAVVSPSVEKTDSDVKAEEPAADGETVPAVPATE